MKTFKDMQHDKCIEGSNPFRPCECEWFCYSKQYLPVIYFPEWSSLMVVVMTDDANPFPIETNKIELKRVYGPPDEEGYYTYIKF